MKKIDWKHDFVDIYEVYVGIKEMPIEDFYQQLKKRLMAEIIVQSALADMPKVDDDELLKDNMGSFV